MLSCLVVFPKTSNRPATIFSCTTRQTGTHSLSRSFTLPRIKNISLPCGKVRQIQEKSRTLFICYVIVSAAVDRKTRPSRLRQRRPAPDARARLALPPRPLPAAKRRPPTATHRRRGPRRLRAHARHLRRRGAAPGGAARPADLVFLFVLDRRSYDGDGSRDERRGSRAAASSVVGDQRRVRARLVVAARFQKGWGNFFEKKKLKSQSPKPVTQIE